jgi:ABC-type transport system substrate-binding protein
MRHLWLGSYSLVLALSACTAPSTRQAGDPIRIRWARDPETLDPLAQANQFAVEALNLLHSGLLQVNYQTNEYVPALAEALPTVQLLGDSLTQLDYHLRAAAAWDDGQPVLATDVDFTLKLLNCPGLPNEGVRSQYSFIRQLQLDPAAPRHFKLVCQGQVPDYTWASGDFPVLSEAVLDPTHSLRQFSLASLQKAAATTPALLALAKRYQSFGQSGTLNQLPGCGPYRLADWQPNRSLTFKRKATWWADQLQPVPLVLQAFPKAIKYSILPEKSAAMLALRRHELDVYPQMSARDFQRLKSLPLAQQEFAFYSNPSYDILYAGFNTQRDVLSDKFTRQALSCLFDPAGLLAGTQLGQGQRTVGLLPPNNPYYNDSLPLPIYAPDQATQLLRRAGWQRAASGWQRAPAQRLALSVRYRTNDEMFETAALQFRAAAAKLGIPVELRPTEGSALTSALHAGDFDMFVRVLKGSPSSVNFAPILHSRSVDEGNFMGFRSLTADGLLEAIEVAGPKARKRQLLRKFQVLMRDEAPLLPLFFLSQHLAANRHLSHLLPSGFKPGYSAAAIISSGNLPAVH